MEPALLITTPGFVHIFEEIINQINPTSVFKSSLVCRSWWQVIRNHPKRWRCVIRRIRIKETLIHQDFRGIMESVETKKELKELGLVLKQFCEDKPRDSASTYDVFLQFTGSNTRDSNFMNDFRNFPASNFMTDFEIVEIGNERRRREAARAAARHGLLYIWTELLSIYFS